MSTIDPNNVPVPGQQPATTTKPAGQQDPGDFMQMFSALGGAAAYIMQAQAQIQAEGKEGVSGTAAVGSHTSVENAHDNSKFYTGATAGFSINNPQIPDPDHANIEHFMEKFVVQVSLGQDPFGSVPPEIIKLAIALYIKDLMTTGGVDGKGFAGVDGIQGTAGGSGPPPAHVVAALAYLGGLTAVSLFEILSKFTKSQSDTEKLASELSLKLRKAEIEGAKSQADIVLEKAAIAIAALITQMIIGVAAAGVQIGGAAHAMRPGADAMMASVENAMWAGVSQMISTVGEKGSEIIKTAMTAPLEAQEIMLRAYSEQIQRASQSMDKLGDDSHALVDKAIDLLRQMMSALMQSFNKIGQ